MSTSNLAKFGASGLLGFHFTPEELFIGLGQRQGRNMKISALDCVPTSQYMLEGGEFNMLTMVPKIQQLLKLHKIATKRAVISFPVKFPWIRVLDVPVMADREMERVVRLEVERLYLDSTVDKLIDYYPLDDNRARSGDATTPVLSVAIPRTSVAPYVELMSAAKLELVGIDLAEVSVLKLASLQGISFSEGITLILNFNMQNTDLMLMENGTLQLVRKIGQGKQQLRELINRSLPPDDPSRRDFNNVDYRLPAEHLKATNEYAGNLLGEIRRSVEFYLTELKRAEGNVSKLVLAGSGYWPANLQDILAQQVMTPMVDLRFESIHGLNCETPFSPGFPACGVYAPVVGSVLAGVS